MSKHRPPKPLNVPPCYGTTASRIGTKRCPISCMHRGGCLTYRDMFLLAVPVQRADESTKSGRNGWLTQTGMLEIEV